MKQTFSTKKSAFSLIELSIVLIIIGLLIAGVTGGASLIKSSQLRAAISEARGYAVAVNGFYSQYSALPGDYELQVAGSNGFAGSILGSNGKIEYYAADATYNSESVVAWEQLIATGTINATLNLTYDDVEVEKQIVGTHMPASKIKFAGWHFDYRNNVGVEGDYADANPEIEGSSKSAAEQNVVVLTVSTQVSTSGSGEKVTLVNGATNSAYTLDANGAITGPDALSIDTKIDDGFANAGKVRGLNPGTYPSSGTPVCYTTSTTENQQYNVSHSSNKVCNLTFQVDVNS